MSDLIERQAAIDALEREKVYCTAYREGYSPTNPFEKYNSGLVDGIKALKNLPSAQPEQKWIPCSERLPEEDYWLGGSGRQFSDNVLVSILNSNDEDAWTDVSHTIDGEWMLELPRYCKIIAWMPLPESYRGE